MAVVHTRGRAGRQGDHPQRRGRDRGRASGLRPGVVQSGVVLTPRQELILRKVVEAHTATGEPVGSKTLAADPRARLRAVDDPQRARHARGARPARPPAHERRTRADRRRPPLLRRSPAARHDVSPRDAASTCELVRREVDEAMRITTETLSQVTNLLAIVSAPPIDTATDPPRRGPAAAAAGADGRGHHLDRRGDQEGAAVRAAGRPGPRRLGRRLPQRAPGRRQPRRAHAARAAQRPVAGGHASAASSSAWRPPSPSWPTRPRTASTSTAPRACSRAPLPGPRPRSTS